ncbi:MAG TPA: TlyA family RNA methyltransferase [Verrucomicrobiota bacterium]|nr:TlyA family RNA methyltransferase [Verrucomicrobiota bacterium]
MRLDQLIVERGLCASREQAQRTVLAGRVRLNGRPAPKPGTRVRPADAVELEAGEPFVSRGGPKLDHALAHFALDVTGLRALDVGASTGGFTDCLLQRGAAHVTAVDVGRGLLAWKLRQDPRVTCLEGVNARRLTPAAFGADWRPFDLAGAGCSFISLRLGLPAGGPLVRPGGRIVALVKPQFEAGRAEADRGRGVIANPAVHARVLAELEAFAATLPGWRWRGATESPLRGPAGNVEFLALLEREA